MSEPDQFAERARIDALYHAIFEADKRGQALFDDLYLRFARGAKVYTDGGIDAVLKTYKASAQREVIEYIVTRVNRANGVNDEPPTERNDDDLS